MLQNTSSSNIQQHQAMSEHLRKRSEEKSTHRCPLSQGSHGKNKQNIRSTPSASIVVVATAMMLKPVAHALLLLLALLTLPGMWTQIGASSR